MGALGELFALGVYVGNEGLKGYLDIKDMDRISDLEETKNIAILHNQKCLMASFDDKKSLVPEDFKIIKKLNLKFEGANNWPLFRSYQPGKNPWHITAGEARFLTLCLRQAVGVALMAKDNPDFVFVTDDGLYFTRAIEKNGDELTWKNTWAKPDFTQDEQDKGDSGIEFDGEKIEWIKQRVRVSSEIWEMDYSYLHAVIQESPDSRPWYPYVTLWVESNSGCVLSFLLSRYEEQEDIKKYKEKMLDYTLKIIIEGNSIPSEIRVRQKDTMELLKPMAAILGIRLNQREKLKLLDEARKALESSFDRR